MTTEIEKKIKVTPSRKVDEAKATVLEPILTILLNLTKWLSTSSPLLT